MPNYIKKTLKTITKGAPRDNTSVVKPQRVHPGNLGTQEELDNNAAWNKINAELSRKKAVSDSVAKQRALSAEKARILAGIKKYNK